MKYNRIMMFGRYKNGKSAIVLKLLFLIFTILFGCYFIVYQRKKSLNISQILKEWVNHKSTVGIAVGLIEDGKIQYYTYGKKIIDSTEPVTEKTVFEIGSITKLFTTLLLMEMVNNSIKNIDDPIEKYIPGIIIPERNNKKITFRHLASHSSGLPRLPTNFIITSPENPYADYSKEELYEFLKTYQLTRDPGECFEYSNLGVGLLGDVLSLIAQKPFEELLKDHILNPLHMSSTGIILTPEMKQHLAIGHHENKKTSNWNFKSLQGAGALRSTVEDMSQFLAANMDVIDSTLCKKLNACHRGQYAISPQEQVGLGWMARKIEKNENVIIWHNGGTGGYRSFIGFDPVKRRGVVILSNSSQLVDELGLYILDSKNYPLKFYEPLLE